MIIKLLVGGVAVLWLVLTIALTIWWRSKFTYVYFGEGSMMKSWTSTIIGAMLVSMILVSIIGAPIAWIDEHCPYLPDIIVVGLLIRYFMKKKDSSGKENETENEEATEPAEGTAENVSKLESSDDQIDGTAVDSSETVEKEEEIKQ